MQPKERKMHMGLGEAIQRLIHVETAYANNLDTTAHLDGERRMLVSALNQYTLDLGFDCDVDGVPDDVGIFRESASTGCCRILPIGTDGRTAKVTEGRTARPVLSSRRK